MEILKVVGQIAGLGGIALGVLLILYRDVIRKNIFPSLTKDQSFRLLKLITILTWSIAVLGVCGWIFLEINEGQSKHSVGIGISNTGDLQINGDVVIKDSHKKDDK